MPDNNLRRARASVLQRYALTRARQKAWREQPERMELIRRRATDKAKAVKEQKNQRLTKALQSLPDQMTSQELDDLFLNDYLSSKQVTRDSFHKRVRRRGLLAYDPSKGVWLNLSKFFPYAG